MIGSHHWQKSVEKRLSCNKSARFALKRVTIPIPIEHHDVEYRHSYVADINLKIDLGTNTGHAECGQFLIDRYCLYCAHALRHSLITGRKYALIKICT